MTELKSIQLQKRWFLQGMKECPCCGHSFSFCLPNDVYRFWDGYCTECSDAPIMSLLYGEDE